MDANEKKEYVMNYIKSLLSLEEAMEPYKEQKRELRKEYIDNEWLTKDEIWAAVKALRMYQEYKTPDDLNQFFEMFQQKFGPRGA